MNTLVTCYRLPDANLFRCQENSVLQSLNDGIRVFDFRFAYNPGNDTIGFYHCRFLPSLTPWPGLIRFPPLADALLAPDTRMEDLFFGFYNWLNNHPSEAVLVSINHESGTGTPEDSALYAKLYDILNSPLAQKYWVQTNGTVRLYQSYIHLLGTLFWFSYLAWNARRGSRKTILITTV